jgi:glyoxylase-like metal-dependent hydrolase (beta-lactamase superfamily II)
MAAAIELAANLYRIPTARFDLINSFAVVEDDGSVTLIDVGPRTAPPRLAAGLASIGRSLRDVRRIVLTHAHADHAGSASAFVRHTGAGVLAHADDAPAVAGGGRFEPVEVARQLLDGERLDVGGGLRVVHTPGHSPGHISLLHEPGGVLITGDAVVNVFGLRWPPRSLCADFALTRRTALRLAELDYRVAAFSHGPHVTDRAPERVRAFLSAAHQH